MIPRREKKCFLGSALLHAALLVVLFVGPAFLTSKPPALPLLDYIPDELVDAALNRGGNPGAAARLAPPPPAKAPEPVQPPPPQPKPQVKPAEPEPTPEPPKPMPKADSFKLPDNKKTPPKTAPKTEAKAPPTKSLPKVNTTLIVKNSDQIAKQREAERKAAEKAAKEWQNKLNETGKNLSRNLSDSISVEVTPGPGGGGPSVGNWAQVVHSIYDHAWIEPSGAADGRGTAKATIIIARDGSVISASLTSPSGNAALDQSVRTVLDRVREVPAFPAGAKEERRTVVINFKLIANRLPG